MYESSGSLRLMKNGSWIPLTYASNVDAKLKQKIWPVALNGQDLMVMIIRVSIL